MMLDPHGYTIPLPEGVSALPEEAYGGWAIMPERFGGVLVPRAAAVGSPPASEAALFTRASEDIAVVDLVGPMTKRGFFGFTGGSTIRARQAIRAAAQDDTVKGVVLRIESPGGTVAGTKELADDVFTLRGRKPVLAYFEDVGASAAYYVGSQASFVVANEPSVIGSIGVLLVLYDVSKAFEKAGFEAVVVSTGPFKGAGVLGSEITPEQRAYFQELINAQNQIFLRDVVRGRSNLLMPQLKQIADGRVFTAPDATELGLVDKVQTFDAAVADFQTFLVSQRAADDDEKEDDEMSEKNAANQPASIEAIEAACVGASGEFVLGQVKAGATLAQAQAAWAGVQNAELAKAQESATEATKTAEAKDAEIADLKAKLEAKGKVPGNAPVGEASGETTTFENPIAEWQTAIAEVEAGLKAARPNASLQDVRIEAMAIVAERHPELHSARQAAHVARPG